MGMHESMLYHLLRRMSLSPIASIHPLAQSTETSSAPSPRKPTPDIAGFIMPATYIVTNKLFQEYSVSLFSLTLSPCARQRWFLGVHS